MQLYRFYRYLCQLCVHLSIIKGRRLLFFQFQMFSLVWSWSNNYFCPLQDSHLKVNYFISVFWTIQYSIIPLETLSMYHSTTWTLKCAYIAFVVTPALIITVWNSIAHGKKSKPIYAIYCESYISKKHPTDHNEAFIWSVYLKIYRKWNCYLVEKKSKCCHLKHDIKI